MSETPKLYAALVAAQAAVRPVEKDSTNNFHKYKYASGDDVIASARAALNGAGLAVFATRWQVTETPVEWTDGDGKLCKDVALRLAVTFRAVHDSGEVLDFEPFGVPVLPEKGRPIDKAEAGARTYALSYFLRDLLLIPRVDEGADVDARDDREHAPRPQNRSEPFKSPQRLAAEASVPVGIKKARELANQIGGDAPAMVSEDIDAIGLALIDPEHATDPHLKQALAELGTLIGRLKAAVAAKEAA